MNNKFIENFNLGKNTWWRYVLSIVSPIVFIIIANIIVRQILPIVKSTFPDNPFVKEISTFGFIFLIFGLGLLAFMITASKLHKRPILSFINLENKFNWKRYFSGFFLFAVLLFTAMLITDFASFQTFLTNFNANQFIILCIVGFISIGVQSFFEEIIVRGYWLQGLHLKIKKISILILVNALIFGLLHFGYGLESFLSSFLFGISFTLIIFFQDSIEFASGAHNANNLLLSLVFLDLSEATNESFKWSINWADFSIHILLLLIFTGLAYQFFRKKK